VRTAIHTSPKILLLVLIAAPSVWYQCDVWR
jgi:hypothetical protein